MRVLRSITVICLGAVIGVSAGAKDHTFVNGKLLDATTDERLEEGTTLRRAMFTVQVGDIVYTLRGERVRLRTKNITHGLIVGDEVQVSVEGEHLYLRTPDGKDMKTDIMKRARPQTP